MCCGFLPDGRTSRIGRKLGPLEFATGPFFHVSFAQQGKSNDPASRVASSQIAAGTFAAFLSRALLALDCRLDRLAK